MPIFLSNVGKKQMLSSDWRFSLFWSSLKVTDWLTRNDVMSTFRPQVDILINTEYNERSCSFHQKNRIANAIYRDRKLLKSKFF